MKAVQIHGGFFLVLSRGEELFSTMTTFCTQTEIHWAQFSAIGAVEDVEIGYYDLPNRHYVFRQEEGPFEVVSLDGNVAELEQEPLIHVHSTLGRCDESLSTIGGHLRRAVVAVTLEVCLWEVTQPLLREYDEDTGLNLITTSV